MRYTKTRRGRGAYTDTIDHEFVFCDEPGPSQSIAGCAPHTALSHSGERPGGLTIRLPGRAKACVLAISAWANSKSKIVTLCARRAGLVVLQSATSRRHSLQPVRLNANRHAGKLLHQADRSRRSPRSRHTTHHVSTTCLVSSSMVVSPLLAS
jgi:hypothetical protein